MTMTDKSGSKKRNQIPDDFVPNKVKSAISALLSAGKAKAENSLFQDSTFRILLDITAFRIARSEKHFYNVVLPHSPHPFEPDILLVIPDDMKTRKDPELIVPEVKDKLNQYGIKIREVMTLKQFRDEYSTHEAKRQLAKRIDVILSDRQIFQNMFSQLGREFYELKKLPISIQLDKKLEEFDKDAFDLALRKTVLNISKKGVYSTVVAGNSHLSEEELTDNISKLSNWLMREFPGGWANIAKLSVRIADTPPLVVYLCKGNRNDVQGIGKTKHKNLKPVEDDLSTLPGRRVRVHADGQIKVLREKLSKEEAELVQMLKDKPFGNKGIKRPKKFVSIPQDMKIEEPKAKKPKVNIEQKYIDETSKKLEFEEKANVEEITKSKKRKSKQKKKISN